MIATLLTREEGHALTRRNDVFRAFDSAGAEYTIRWQRRFAVTSDPTANNNGVSGWCVLNGVPGRRVHVCASIPCQAMHVDRNWGSESGQVRR